MDATLHKPGWSAVGILSHPLNAMFFHSWDLNYNPTLHAIYMLSPFPTPSFSYLQSCAPFSVTKQAIHSC